MNRLAVLAAAIVLVAGACGGGGDGAAEPSAASSPVVVEEPTSAPPETPDDLAMTDQLVALHGASGLTAAPGETVTVDHLVENRSGTTRTIAIAARNPSDGLAVEVAPTTLRLGPGDVAPLTTTLRVAEETAGEGSFDVVAVVADDTSARASLTVTVGVAPHEGRRPALGNDRATTGTSERVITYVVGNDTDPDEDLDLSTLRIVAGAGRAADAVALPDGTITYEPFANRTGTDVVLYELCDTTGLCDTGALTVTVQG